MKRILALILSFVLMFALAVPAFAVSSEAVDAANALHELGLFNGTGADAAGNPNFDLDRTPTRYEAVTMLVRLLGKEAEAKAGAWTTPFADVADWARPYVGYAYANGLTSGTSATAYGGNCPVTASQYLTFVLRALGYQSGTDFQWDEAWKLSDKIGLTNGEYNANTPSFTRGDVAVISNQVLHITLKSSDVTLLLLIQSGNKSTNITKAEILETYTNGLEIAKAGTEQMLLELNELDEVLDESYSDIYLLPHYVAILQKEQSHTKMSIEYFNQAIDLCGSYTDTQEMKKYLGELVQLYHEHCNYNITTANATEYVNDLSNFQNQQNIIFEKIRGVVDRWVAENT